MKSIVRFLTAGLFLLISFPLSAGPVLSIWSSSRFLEQIEIKSMHALSDNLGVRIQFFPVASERDAEVGRGFAIDIPAENLDSFGMNAAEFVRILGWSGGHITLVVDEKEFVSSTSTKPVLGRVTQLKFKVAKEFAVMNSAETLLNPPISRITSVELDPNFPLGIVVRSFYEADDSRSASEGFSIGLKPSSVGDTLDEILRPNTDFLSAVVDETVFRSAKPLNVVDASRWEIRNRVCPKFLESFAR